jgi:hypothetical protein
MEEKLLGKCGSASAFGLRLPLCCANLFLGISIFINYSCYIFLILSILIVVQFELCRQLNLIYAVVQFELSGEVQFELCGSSF